MSPIVSIVSPGLIFRQKPVPALASVRRATKLNWLPLTSRRQTVHTGSPEQIGELLAGIEHPGLHRALGDADDRADLFHRLLIVVDEVDDLAMRRLKRAIDNSQVETWERPSN